MKNAEIKIRVTDITKANIKEQASKVNMNMSEYISSLVDRDNERIQELECRLRINHDIKILRQLEQEVRLVTDSYEIRDYTEECNEYHRIAERLWEVLKVEIPKELDTSSVRRIEESSPSYDEEVYFLSMWKHVSKNDVVELLTEVEHGVKKADVTRLVSAVRCVNPLVFKDIDRV